MTELTDDPLSILIKKENDMAKPTKIEVEDFGASIAEEIIYISRAIKNTILTDRALALLIRDKSNIGLGDIVTVLETIRNMERIYVKRPN
jgi:hypothetical protein